MPLCIGPMPDGHYARYWESVGMYCYREQHDDCVPFMELGHLEYHICTCPCHKEE